MKFDPSKRQTLRPVEELFGANESAGDAGVTALRLDQLQAFREHPFRVQDDEEMAALTDSVRENGVLTPIVVRPLPNRKYEILSGHRRTRAARLAGLSEIPAIVRELDDDAATILMVDSNLQREKILPSEKAMAYKLRMEAIKHQAGRPRSNDPKARGSESRDELAEQVGESAGQIQRYIRLNYLAPGLLDAVDDGRIPMNAGVTLSYLPTSDQEQIRHAFEQGKIQLTLARASELKDAARLGTLSTLLAGPTPHVSREKSTKPVDLRLDYGLYTEYFGSRKPREIMPLVEEALREYFARHPGKKNAQ